MKKNLSTFISHLSSRSGFTLIELLVVIVIIGILSALLSVNFIGIRQRGRDTQRKSDLNNIRSALETYRSDNGLYPTTAAFPVPVCSAGGTPFVGLGPNPPTYMSKVPCDPLGSNSTYNSGKYYYVSADGLSYTISACLENVSDNDPNDTATQPPDSTGTCTRYFVLQNP